MKNNYELSALNLKSQEAFEKKQKIWQECQDAKDAVEIAKKKLEISWITFVLIRELMDESYSELKERRKQKKDGYICDFVQSSLNEQPTEVVSRRFKSYRSQFKRAKAAHELIKNRLQSARHERDRLKVAFDSAQKEFIVFHDDFKNKLEDFKEQKHQEGAIRRRKELIY